MKALGLVSALVTGCRPQPVSLCETAGSRDQLRHVALRAGSVDTLGDRTNFVGDRAGGRFSPGAPSGRRLASGVGQRAEPAEIHSRFRLLATQPDSGALTR